MAAAALAGMDARGGFVLSSVMACGIMKCCSGFRLYIARQLGSIDIDGLSVLSMGSIAVRSVKIRTMSSLCLDFLILNQVGVQI